jgi:hypothetical protein
MTDETRRQTIERLIHAIDTEHWTEFKDIFELTAVYEVPGQPPIIGLDALLNYYRRERDVVDGRHQIDGVIIEGSHAFAWGRFSGMTRAGKQLRARFADRYVFEGPLICKRMVYYFR